MSDRQLTSLADRGVIGIRFNLSTHGMSQFVAPGVERLLARVKEMGWLLQVHYEKDELVEAAPILRRAGVRVMVDHFGRPDVASGLAHPGFQTLLELGRTGNAVVKLSGPSARRWRGIPTATSTRSSRRPSRRSPSTAASGAPTGPFVRIDQRMDYGPPLVCLQRWLPDPADRRTVLWDTPARLFGLG